MTDSIHPGPGRLIAGKYQLESLLGEGAMGTVWLARHVNLDQRVAIKLIRPELASSEAVRTRFEAEAKAAAALRSRFVVQVHDSGINEEGVPYLAMEYLRGESLETRVERDGPLPLGYAVQVLAQASRGLSRAHAAGIVHRDLKPANVFLAETDDGEEVAKILDFGIAKFRNHQGASVSSTATGTVVGTPLFMSPEQARGQKNVDHRSDLYSLGAVAFWALTAKHAYGGEALGELIISICTKPLPSIRVVAPELPATLDQWYHRACARDPNARFQSADDLVAALIDAAGIDAEALRAAGVLPRLSQVGSQVTVGSGELQDRRSGSSYPGTQSPRFEGTETLLAAATQASAVEKPGARGRTAWLVMIAVACILLAIGGGVFAMYGRGTTATERGPDLVMVPAASELPAVELVPEPASASAQQSTALQEPSEEPLAADEEGEAPAKDPSPIQPPPSSVVRPTRAGQKPRPHAGTPATPQAPASAQAGRGESSGSQNVPIDIGF